MKEVVIKINKGKQILLIMFGVLFVVAGFFLLLSDDMNGGLLIIKFIAMLCILFFGFAVFAGIKQLIRDTYVLKMNNQGLYIHGFPEVCFLWKDIERFFEYTVESQKIIGIKLTDESAYLESLPSALRRACKLNKGMGAPTFSFSALSSNYKSDELLKLTQEYWAYYRDNIDSRL